MRSSALVWPMTGSTAARRFVGDLAHQPVQGHRCLRHTTVFPNCDADAVVGDRNDDSFLVNIEANIPDTISYDASPMHESRRRSIRRYPPCILRDGSRAHADMWSSFWGVLGGRVTPLCQPLRKYVDAPSFPNKLISDATQPLPTSLMTGTKSGSVVAVEVLIEQQVISPSGVALEFLSAAEDRPAAILIAQKNPTQTTGDFASNLEQVHQPGGTRWTSDFEI